MINDRAIASLVANLSGAKHQHAGCLGGGGGDAEGQKRGTCVLRGGETDAEVTLDKGMRLTALRRRLFGMRSCSEQALRR